MADRSSVFSHEERAVAARLREGDDVATIAEDRGMSAATVERTVERIREKTARAAATLLDSPFTDAVVADLDDDERAELRDAL